MVYRQKAREMTSEGLVIFLRNESKYEEDSVEYSKIQDIKREFGILAKGAVQFGGEAFHDFKEYFDDLEDLLETVGDS